MIRRNHPAGQVCFQPLYGSSIGHLRCPSADHWLHDRLPGDGISWTGCTLPFKYRRAEIKCSHQVTPNCLFYRSSRMGPRHSGGDRWNSRCSYHRNRSIPPRIRAFQPKMGTGRDFHGDLVCCWSGSSGRYDFRRVSEINFGSVRCSFRYVRCSITQIHFFTQKVIKDS